MNIGSLTYANDSKFVKYRALENNQLYDTVKPLLSGLLLSKHLPQPGSWFTLFYADIAEIVGNTVGVAY